VSTAIIGTYLMRAQGAAALGQIKSSLSEGSAIRPKPLVHGAMIPVAGCLAADPGVFSLMLSAFALFDTGRAHRAAFKASGSRLVVIWCSTWAAPPGLDSRMCPIRPMQGDVIDGEYHEAVRARDRGPKRPSAGTDHEARPKRSDLSRRK